MFNQIKGNHLMKKFLLMLCILGLSAIAPSQNLKAQRIKGSDTMLPLSQKQAESFMKANSKANTTVTGGGSGVGISALVEGTTDIAQSSRKIRFDERRRIQNSGNSVTEIIAAYDALAVVIHPTNRVTNLTREQLEGIFTGKITN